MRFTKDSSLADLCLATLLGTTSPGHKPQRDGVLKGLGYITGQCGLVNMPGISQCALDKLDINVEELEITDSLPAVAHFFEQMSEAKIKEHRVATDQETQELLAQSDEEINKIASGELAKSGYQVAELFARRLALEMSTFKREGVSEGKDKTLISLTNWRYMEKFVPLVLRTDYYKLVFREKERTRSSPVGVWYEYDRHQVPHLMISMKHEFDWTEDLLVAEVNVITSSLLSRLKAATDIHITMPMTLFSFGPRHGRIIQAFHDGMGLMIRKSKLINLLDTSTRPFDIFARFAASKPVGNTRSVPSIFLSQAGKPHHTPAVNFFAGVGEAPRMNVIVDYNRLLDPIATAQYEDACKAKKAAEAKSEGDTENTEDNKNAENAENAENVDGNGENNGA